MVGFGVIDHMMVAAYVYQKKIFFFKFNEVIQIDCTFLPISKLFNI